MHILKKKQQLFAIVFSVFLSMPVIAASDGANWTHYFKSWENACDIGNSLNMFQNLYPQYTDVYYELDRNYSGKIPFKPGKIVVPSKYRSSVKSRLNTTFSYPEKSSLQTKYLTREFNYFDSSFRVIGTYYGMAIREIGGSGTMSSGNASFYFTLDAPMSQVLKTLKARKVSFNSKYSDYHGEEVGAKLFTVTGYPNRTRIYCY